jgi:hypothetical protein
MSSDRIVYHVVPNADQARWVVRRENDDDFRLERATRQEAVEVAKSHARREQRSQVKVHKVDGSIETECSYGPDPVQPTT